MKFLRMIHTGKQNACEELTRNETRKIDVLLSGVSGQAKTPELSHV